MPNPPIIVIGGGPAGSCVSTLLARRGYPVMLLERERFPRAHVGESLLPASIPILEDLGALDAVERAGFVVKRGATMVWGTDRQPWSWYFSETNASNPHSYQVWRPEFDAILLHNARRAGVDVREGCSATGVIFDDAGTAVAVRCDETTLPAQFVVDASGQGGLLARQLGLRQWDDFFRNLAVFAYYQGGERLPGPDDGNILIESQPGGWLWNIPLREGWSSVGAVVDAETGQQGHPRTGPATLPGNPDCRRAAHRRYAGIGALGIPAPTWFATGRIAARRYTGRATCWWATPDVSSTRSFPPGSIWH